METQKEYEAREARAFHAQLAAVEKAPIAERREAREEFLRAMRENPELIGERVGWMLNGSYGFGAYRAARDVIARPRSNRVARLSQWIAALEWSCSAVFARQAWKSLSADEARTVDAAVFNEIASAEREARES